ncbi:MAG: cytochrome oxidase putative small subunit CydP [Thiobacillaceae bacterium]
MGPLFKHPLAREIGVILVVKLIVIFAIAHAFFGPDTKPKVDADSVAKAVLDRAVPSPTQH